MEVVIEKDGQAIAVKVANLIEKLLKNKPEAVLGLATGSSPLAVYDELARRYEAGQISFAKARAFMLDEYVGIAEDHPQRYRNVIETEIAGRVDFAPDAVRGPDGNAEDIAAMCAEYDAAIAKAGGTDLQILGIGSDGHIAFNEPGSSLASRTRLKTLTEQTRIDNARFFDGDIDQVPMHCVTQGLATIMTSHHPVLIATGENKADAVAALVEGPVSATCPASVLQLHPKVTVYVDEAAAAKLERADYYRWVYDNKPDWQRE